MFGFRGYLFNVKADSSILFPDGSWKVYAILFVLLELKEVPPSSLKNLFVDCFFFFIYLYSGISNESNECLWICFEEKERLIFINS